MRVDPHLLLARDRRIAIDLGAVLHLLPRERTDRLRESASGSFSWSGGSRTCRPGSQLPVSTTAQRMIQLSSLNRKSSMLPIVPSVASMAYPWMVEAAHSMFRSPISAAPFGNDGRL